jgi:hypothetical protein
MFTEFAAAPNRASLENDGLAGVAEPEPIHYEAVPSRGRRTFPKARNDRLSGRNGSRGSASRIGRHANIRSMPLIVRGSRRYGRQSLAVAGKAHAQMQKYVVG